MKIKSTLLIISATLCIAVMAGPPRLGGGQISPTHQGTLIGYDCIIDGVNHGLTPNREECMIIHDLALEEDDLAYGHHDYILTEDGEVDVETEDECVVILAPVYVF